MEANLRQMLSVMNKPNLYLVRFYLFISIFFKFRAGVSHYPFSLSEQTNLPELLFVYLP